MIADVVVDSAVAIAVRIIFVVAVIVAVENIVFYEFYNLSIALVGLF